MPQALFILFNMLTKLLYLSVPFLSLIDVFYYGFSSTYFSNGQKCHIYQLFMDKMEGILWPNTQYLLETSFMEANIKLAEVQICRGYVVLCFPIHEKNEVTQIPSQATGVVGTLHLPALN